MTLFHQLTQKKHNIVLSLCLMLLVIFLQFIPVSQISYALSRADGLIYDIRLKTMLAPRQKTLAEVIIVDIDETTMEKIGWPWPRKQLAQLVTNLSNVGTVVIAFDVLFAEPERNPAREVAQQLTSQTRAHTAIENLIPQMDGDLAFAASLAQTDVLLGLLLQSDPNVQRGQLPHNAIVTNRTITPKLSALNYLGHVTSLPQLHQASAGAGFINSSPDSDGFLRRSALVSRYQDKLYSSLSLEAARLYALAENVEVDIQPAAKQFNIRGLKIGTQLIPTDAEGRVLIPYRGPQGSFPYISALDILNNNFDHALFDGAVVFVGTSAVGLVDLRATPMGVQFPGVEVHANVFEGLLNPELLHHRPDFWQAMVLVYLLVAGIGLSLLLPLMGPLWMALAAISTLALTLVANFWFWSNIQMALPLASSILLVLLITSYNIAHGFFSESHKRQQIKSIFNQYVPPAHIDKMLESPDEVSMDGERKELTVLFSDIRSFTNISERLSANELKQLLNRYFNPITECIFRHDGTIDKYVGDMVMAFWGAPLEDEEHAQHAVETALEMLRLTSSLRQEFLQQGLPEIRIGIGLNTGNMNVGDMGSSYRRAYTVLGDAVNLGSRLEGLTKFYGLECLVTEQTKKQCQNIQFKLIDKVKVKGKTEAVSIYEPIDPQDLTPELISEIKQHHSAHALYLTQSWSEAEQAFSLLNQQSPNVLLYRLYLQRIKQLKQQELATDWDGSYTHISK